MRRFVAHLFILLSLGVAIAGAQVCETFLGAPPQCLDILQDAIVAVPANETQASLFAKSPVAAYLPVLAGASAECAPAALGFFCPSIFAPCATGSPTPLGRRLCRSVCNALLSGCAKEIQSYGALLQGTLPNCAAIDAAGVPLYPTDTYTFVTANGTSLTETCFAAAPSNSSGACPAGLVRTKDDICFFKCPLYLLSSHQLRVMKQAAVATSILGGIGWISTLVATFARYGRKALRWPHGIIFYFACSSCFLNIVIWMSWFAGWESVICDGSDFATQENNKACAVQGALFAFGFYSAAWWTFWLSVNLISSITVPNWIPPIYLEIAAHVTSFLLPLITVFVGAGKKQLLFPGDVIMCIVGSDGFTTYLYPMCGLVGVSGVGLLIAVGYVFYTAIRTGLAAAADTDRSAQLAALRKHLSKTLKDHWRFIVMSLYSSFGLGLPAGTFLYQQSRNTYVEGLVRDQFLCLSNGGDCHPTPPIPFALMIAVFVVVFFVGVVFGVITFDRRMIAWIRRLIRDRELKSMETDSTVVYDISVSAAEL